MSKVAESLASRPKVTTVEQRYKKASRGFFASSFARFFRHKLNVAALVVFTLVAIASYSAGWVSDTILKQKRDEIDFDLLAKGFQPPVPPGTLTHIMGTDELGRDILARLLYGGQVSLTVGFLTALIAVSIGTTLGLLAGYFGGWVDDLVNLLVQTILNIPALFLLIMLSLYFRPDIISLSLTIGLLSWAGLTRQVRGAVLSLSTRDYISAARVSGASNFRILLVHMLPNVVSLMLVVAGFDVAGAILIESGLSYLGFGIAVPIPSWGSMLADSQSRFTNAPWMVYTPALAIFITVLCVFLIADGLRDAFDPRLKNR
jgi:peptide/nickel transport system permease protein